MRRPLPYWFTVEDLASRLHLAVETARKLVRPFRARCHLARKGSHPRLVLWIPRDVVLKIERQRLIAPPGREDMLEPNPRSTEILSS